jgi:tetratricopeptide (TPR) repeat protein
MTEADVVKVDDSIEIGDEGERIEGPVGISRGQRIALIGLAVVAVLGLGIAVFSQNGGDTNAPGQEARLPGNMFEVGLQLHQNGLYEQALMAYRNVLETDPGSAPVHYNMGQIYQVRGDLTVAINEYNEALETNPDLVPAIYNRALAYRDQGKNAEAIRGLESVLSREPNNVGALYNLGNVLIAEGRTNEGTKLVNRAIELDPSLLQGK